jgi:hypothetical protein
VLVYVCPRALEGVSQIKEERAEREVVRRRHIRHYFRPPPGSVSEIHTLKPARRGDREGDK